MRTDGDLGRSHLAVRRGEDGDARDVVVEKAQGIKCARSWKILPTVGEDAEYPDVSPRDAQALREWKALGVAV